MFLGPKVKLTVEGYCYLKSYQAIFSILLIYLSQIYFHLMLSFRYPPFIKFTEVVELFQYLFQIYLHLKLIIKVFLDLHRRNHQESLERQLLQIPLQPIQMQGPNGDLELVHVQQLARLRDLFQNPLLPETQRHALGTAYPLQEELEVLVHAFLRVRRSYVEVGLGTLPVLLRLRPRCDTLQVFLRCCEVRL